MPLSSSVQAEFGPLRNRVNYWKKNGATQTKKSGGVTFWSNCKKSLGIQKGIEKRFGEVASDRKPLVIVKPTRPEADTGTNCNADKVPNQANSKDPNSSKSYKKIGGGGPNIR